MSSLKYRKNVAAFIVSEDKKLLICERSDVPGAWQVPQGGVDEGEELKETLKRELYEEIGISKYQILDSLPEAISYDWPEELHSRGYKGQEQYYFLIEINKSEKIRFDCDPDNIEFISFKWVDVDKFIQFISGFKKEAYIKALAIFQERKSL